MLYLATQGCLTIKSRCIRTWTHAVAGGEVTNHAPPPTIPSRGLDKHHAAILLTCLRYETVRSASTCVPWHCCLRGPPLGMRDS